MDRPDLLALRAQVVDGGLDVLGGRAEGDEDGLGVVGPVLREEPVVPPRQLPELGVGRLEHRQDRLAELGAVRDHPVHVVLLVLHGAEEERVLKVDHPRHAAPLRSEEGPLGVGRAVDQVVGSAEELAHQLGLVAEERPLEVRGEETVLDVDARRQRQLGDLPDDQRLVGRLLRVLSEEHHPAGVHDGVDVVVPAVDVERVLGERAGRDLEDHRRELAGRVVVLLGAVDDSLPRGEVHGPLPADRERDGSALRRVLALRLAGELAPAEDVQVSLGERELVVLAHLRRRRDRVEDTAVRDARFRVVGDELVPVRRDPDPGVARRSVHSKSPWQLLAKGH